MRAAFFGLSALDRNKNLTTSSIVLAITIAVQASVCPFKKKLKHYNELLFILNLLILYTLSFGDYEVGVNIMITISAVQLVIIIIYHIITNVCGGVIMPPNIISTIIGWITRQRHLQQGIDHELNNYLQHKELFIGDGEE